MEALTALEALGELVAFLAASGAASAAVWKLADGSGLREKLGFGGRPEWMAEEEPQG